MSHSWHSSALLQQERISLRHILAEFSTRGWHCHSPTAPMTYSVSNVDLTEELLAVSEADLTAAISIMQKRIDVGRQVAVTVSNHAYGSCSLCFTFESHNAQLSCHYACHIPERRSGGTDFNWMAEFMLEPLQACGVSVREASVTWSRE